MRRIDLATLRKDHDLTQKELAKLLGCGQSFVSQMEKMEGANSRLIPEEKIAKLEERFGNISKYYQEVKVVYAEAKSSDFEKESDIGEFPAYIPKNTGYVSVPSTLLTEISKLTDTIHSQQRTIETLVKKHMLS